MRCRARDLGAPLALSIVAHGGAVAAMGALTAAWLAGSPPVPPPPALYVDLVHPVVATRDRSEATDTSRPSSGIARPQAPLGGPEPRPSSSVTRSSDRPPADPDLRTAEPDRPASTTPEGPHPPAVSEPPAAPGLSVPGVEPVIPAPVAMPAAVLPSAVAPPAAMPPAASSPAAMPPAAMPPAPSPPAALPPATPSPAPLLAAPRPAAPAPVESGSHGPARDTATASPTRTSRIAPTSSSDLADGGLAVPLPDAKASGLSRGPGGVEAEDPSDPKGSARTDGPGSGSADSPAAAGTALARLPAGEPRGGSGSDGAIPPEYEPYVRALRQRIQDRLVYPWTSVRRGQQGVVELEVRVGPDGRLVAVEVLAGRELGCLARGRDGGGARCSAVPVPAGTRRAPARHPAPRRVPTALRGHNLRFFFDALGTWAIVNGTMSADLTTVLSVALLDALGRAGLPSVSPAEVAWEVPRDPTHGDYATNVAMLLAKSQRRSPRQVAEAILAHLPCVDEIERAEVAGPGFLNIFLAPAYCRAGLARILGEGERFGTDVEGRGQRAMVEFVSANPTGPLTLGHGRQGILGDCVARLFRAMGYETTREYYFNNAGRQMRVLGESVRARYLELLGRSAAFPQDGYQGDYIREIAAALRDRHGEALQEEGHDDVFRQAAEDAIFADIRRTLDRLGIRFDVYSNEALLYTEREGRGHPVGAPRGGARLREGRCRLAPLVGHGPAARPGPGEVHRRADVPAPGHCVPPGEARPRLRPDPERPGRRPHRGGEGRRRGDRGVGAASRPDPLPHPPVRHDHARRRRGEDVDAPGDIRDHRRSA